MASAAIDPHHPPLPPNDSRGPQTLADVIRADLPSILQEWEAFAKSLFAGRSMSKTALQDHARDILEAVAADMQQPQSAQTQKDKSKGMTPHNSPALKLAGEQHAVQRAAADFSLVDLVAEYRALRSSVLRRWAERKEGRVGLPDEITRFNEAIDEALAASIHCYAQKNDDAQTVILGVLAHDLRNPLHVALLSATYIIQDPTANVKCIQSAARIKSSIVRSNQLVSDLIDYACFKLGQGMPMTPRAGNLQSLCSNAVEEVEAAHPGRCVTQAYSGEMNGAWDSERIGQLLCNLLINALKHGPPDGEVLLTSTGTKDTVVIGVHNDGPPIPDSAQDALFVPLYLKGGLSKRLPDGSSGLGLGLYICREIANAHGGSLDMVSTAQAGTTFTLTLPRVSRARAGQAIPA